jgi:hypothetical protein
MVIEVSPIPTKPIPLYRWVRWPPLPLLVRILLLTARQAAGNGADFQPTDGSPTSRLG